jgi:hypothetical protein
MTVLMESTKYVEETLRPGVRFVNFISSSKVGRTV